MLSTRANTLVGTNTQMVVGRSEDPALGARWLLVGDSGVRDVSGSRVANPRSGGGLPSTFEVRGSPTSEDRPPVAFVAKGGPVMTPATADVLARIVRALRDRQKARGGVIRFALSARTSTDDLQDPADSLRWQTDVATRLDRSAWRDRGHVSRHRQKPKSALGTSSRSLSHPDGLERSQPRLGCACHR